MEEVVKKPGQKFFSAKLLIVLLMIIIIAVGGLFFMKRFSAVLDSPMPSENAEALAAKQRAELIAKLQASLSGTVWQAEYSTGKIKTATYSFSGDTVDLSLVFINEQTGSLSFPYTYSDGRGQFGREDRPDYLYGLKLDEDVLVVTQVAGEETRFTLVNSN